MELKGEAVVTLGKQKYSFPVAQVKLGFDEKGEEQITLGGTNKTWSSGQTASIEVPLKDVSPEFIDLVTGRISEPRYSRERVHTHPDGSETWVEVKVLPDGQRKMRTVYASEWSNYLPEWTRCDCCTCKDISLDGVDTYCPAHGAIGARPCEEHNTTGVSCAHNEAIRVVPISVQELREEQKK